MMTNYGVEIVRIWEFVEKKLWLDTRGKITLKWLSIFGDLIDQSEHSIVRINQSEHSVDTHLTSIVTRVSASTEAGGWQDEDLLRDGIDLPDTLVVVDDGDASLADPQGNGSSWKQKHFSKYF